MLIGQKSDISFKVNVMGTSAEPTARVIIETTPAISFTALKVGDSWVAPVHLPNIIVPGTYRMKVEVLLNNRLFTPFSKMIDVQAPALATPSVPTEMVPPEAIVPQPMQTDAPAKLPSMAAVVEEPKKVTLPPDFFKFDLRAPVAEKVTIKHEPIIAKIEVKAVTEAASPVKVSKKVKKVVEIQHSLPVVLVKGDIIFE
jgi:hypothetical protein